MSIQWHIPLTSGRVFICINSGAFPFDRSFQRVSLNRQQQTESVFSCEQEAAAFYTFLFPISCIFFQRSKLIHNIFHIRDLFFYPENIFNLSLEHLESSSIFSKNLQKFSYMFNDSSFSVKVMVFISTNTSSRRVAGVQSDIVLHHM